MGSRRSTGAACAALVVAAAALLGSCERAPSTPEDRAFEALQRQRVRWERKGVSSYGYTLRRTCSDCGDRGQEAVRMEVRNGASTSMTYVGTGEPADPRHFSTFNTVPLLFEEIATEIDDGAEVSAQYDPEYAHPTTATFTPAGGGAASGFRVDGLTPLP